MNLISFLIRVSRRTVVLAILLGVVSGASAALLIALINHTLHGPASRLPVLAEAFAGLGAIMLLSGLLSQIFLIHLSQGTIHDLRLELSRRILAAPQRRLEELGAPRLLATLTDDVNDIAAALLQIPNVCIFGTTILVCLAYLTWLSWVILAAGIASMVLGVATFELMIHRAFKSLAAARDEHDILHGHLQALTHGTKELKLNAGRRAAFLDQCLAHSAGGFRRLNISGQSLLAAARAWGDFLFFVFIGVVLFVLPHIRAISPSAVTGSTLTVLYMIAPLSFILNNFQAFGRAAIAFQKVEDLGLPLTARDGALSESLGWGRLELTAVTHSYRREREEWFTLGPIDLTLSPGELVFLIGGNGSGKTTLAKLLTGIYAPESGAIRVDGRAVDDGNREAYRQLFSVVFSDFYLFESLLGASGPNRDTEARRLLAELQLDHKVSIDGGVFSTTALSQGQRKRLALLAAFIEDRPCYLFDEWAADQDPMFKDVFYNELLPALKERGKTVFVITHDDRYCHVADRVVKLEYGKLAGHGEPFAARPVPPEPLSAASLVFAQGAQDNVLRQEPARNGNS